MYHSGRFFELHDGLWCTDFFNKLLMFVLFGVLLLQYWHDLTGWRVTAYIKGGMMMLFGGIASMIAPIYDIAAWWQLRRTVEKDGINEKMPNADVLSDLWGSDC